MPRNGVIEGLLEAGTLGRRWRALTCAPVWPAGDPPFAAGSRVQVPAIPATPSPYDPDDFDAEAWTDCTALTADYRYSQDGAMLIDQLSLVVPADWQASLAAVFREMRFIVIQQQFSDGVTVSDWLNLCYCISGGYRESWEGGYHHYVVEAQDVLKLAHLDGLGTATGSAVYQPDLVEVGTLAEPASLALVAEATDAYEFGVTVDGTAPGAVQPNWADKPAAQCWCTNARDKDGAVWPEPVPLAIGGQAVQAVLGEGVVRVGKTWAHTTSAKNGTTDFSQGLGIPAGTAPVITCALYRFAHPGTVDRNGAAVPSDLAEGLTQVASPAVAGRVQVAGDISDRPAGLSVLLDDGSGARYLADVTTPLTYDAGSGRTTITLTEPGAVIPTGTALRYGDANRATDTLVMWLLGSGFQQMDAAAPLYIVPPETPIVRGVAQEIVLPPLVYQDTEASTPAEAFEGLRRNGYLPPYWVMRGTDAGQVVTHTVTLREADDPATVPVGLIASSPGLEHDRTDLDVKTRVVARGLWRQIADATQAAGVMIADVAAADGGLPTVTIGTYNTVTVPLAGVPTDFHLHGLAVRASGDIISNSSSYLFSLKNIFQRDLPSTTAGQLLRPWGWTYFPAKSAAGLQQAEALRRAWEGRLLCEITFLEPVRVETLELDVSCAWATDTTDWGQENHGRTLYTGSLLGGTFSREARTLPQTLAVEYYEASRARWRPLVSSLQCPVACPQVLQIPSDEFDTRETVETTKLRIRCIAPFVAEFGYDASATYELVLGAWLSQVKIWGSAEIRGVAELGSAGNFNGELAADPWPAIRARMRRRTYVLPEAVPWVSDQATADWLALEWLKEKCSDLAPWRMAVIRPDVRLWDTVVFTTPQGETITALVIGAEHGTGAETVITCVNFTRPYYEEFMSV